LGSSVSSISPEAIGLPTTTRFRRGLRERCSVSWAIASLERLEGCRHLAGEPGCVPDAVQRPVPVVEQRLQEQDAPRCNGPVEVTDAAGECKELSAACADRGAIDRSRAGQQSLVCGPEDVGQVAGEPDSVLIRDELGRPPRKPW
jgi:hypothetical protein